MTKRYKLQIHDLSLEEADKRMASAGSIPFSREEIDAMVRSATAGLHIVSGNQSPSRSPDMSPDMRDETDCFWQELMKKVSEADSAPDLTMEEAEERMAAAEEAAPYSDEEVVASVRSATAEEPSSHLRVLEPEPAPVHRNFFLRHSRTLTKVAAVFLGIAMLYSVLGREIAFDERLEFMKWNLAMDSMLDPHEDLDPRDAFEERMRGRTTVYDAARLGIATLRELLTNREGLGARADGHLDDLRQAMQASEIALEYGSVQPMTALRDRVRDTAIPFQERLISLQAIADQIRNSVFAHRQVQAWSAGDLNLSVTIALRVIAKDLER